MLDLIETLKRTLNITSMSPPLPTYDPEESSLATDGMPPAVRLVFKPENESMESEQSMTFHREFLPPSPNTTVETVFEACLKGIQALGSLSEEIRQPSQATILRMKLWGTGLFFPHFSLDNVLASQPEVFEVLRTCILRILVNIAATTGKSSSILYCGIRHIYF